MVSVINLQRRERLFTRLSFDSGDLIPPGVVPLSFVSPAADAASGTLRMASMEMGFRRTPPLPPPPLLSWEELGAAPGRLDRRFAALPPLVLVVWKPGPPVPLGESERSEAAGTDQLSGPCKCAGSMTKARSKVTNKQMTQEQALVLPCCRCPPECWPPLIVCAPPSYLRRSDQVSGDHRADAREQALVLPHRRHQLLNMVP